VAPANGTEQSATQPKNLFICLVQRERLKRRDIRCHAGTIRRRPPLVPVDAEV
jgi:hypothetical protein